MKEKLRKEIKEKRRKLSKEEQRKKSKLIKRELFSLKEYKNVKTVLFYVSYNSEVFTHDMIKDALEKKKVVVPISNVNNETLILSILESWSDLKPNSYGILEPKREYIKEISINDIELIIVPGVAFDKYGNRVGHGKGYYDKLLEKAKAKSVGLCFEFQLSEKIPIKSYDIPVDMIITEKRIIYCYI
jgi:5-formyltetrahydrofolate cyclo-ligase